MRGNNRKTSVFNFSGDSALRNFVSAVARQTEGRHEIITRCNINHRRIYPSTFIKYRFVQSVATKACNVSFYGLTFPNQSFRIIASLNHHSHRISFLSLRQESAVRETFKLTIVKSSRAL